MTQQLDRIEALMNKRFDAMDKRFDAMDRRFDSIDRRFDGIERSLRSTDQSIEFLHNKLDIPATQDGTVFQMLGALAKKINEFSGRLDNLEQESVKSEEYERDCIRIISALIDITRQCNSQIDIKRFLTHHGLYTERRKRSIDQMIEGSEAAQSDAD